MQGTAFVRSPAKLNLHLEVQSKREDGFHSILSIFQLIDLWDDISISSLKERNVCQIHGMPDVPMEENLIYRAVEAFRRETGTSDGFRIEVVKRIPAGAGLGGGSSNGAYTLRLLDRLCNTGLTAERIAELGAGLGSDVPFFCTAPCAVVTGRGEIVRPVKPRGDLWCMLVVPDFAVSTRDAYAAFDLMEPEVKGLTADEIVDLYRNESPAEWRFENSLQKVMEKQHPDLAELVMRIAEAGALYSAMSGSGSACFGVYVDRKRALRAEKGLEKRFKKCWVLHLLDKSPDPVLQ